MKNTIIEINLTDVRLKIYKKKESYNIIVVTGLYIWNSTWQSLNIQTAVTYEIINIIQTLYIKSTWTSLTEDFSRQFPNFK